MPTTRQAQAVTSTRTSTERARGGTTGSEGEAAGMADIDLRILCKTQWQVASTPEVRGTENELVLRSDPV